METLRLENDDPRIIYGPPNLRWSTQELTSVDGDQITVRSTPSDTQFSRVLLLFRGTGFKFYAGGSGNTWLSFDDEPIRSVQTPTLPGGAPLVDVTNLEDTDHQLFVLSSGEIWIDHYELESSTGEGFDPINTGPNATSVPSEAVIIEDTSSNIELEPLANWGYDKDEIYYGNSQVRTNITGSTLTYRFNGTGIWMFGDRGDIHGSRSVTLDDGPPEEFSTKTPGGGHLMQSLLWQKINLEPGEHTLRMELDGHGGIDFLRVLRNEDAGAISSTSQTGGPSAGVSDGVSPDDNDGSTVNVKAIAIGVSVGVLVLFGLIGFFLWRLLQRRKANKAIPSEKPYQIYAPPPGPPPGAHQTEPPNHEAERPSLEDTPSPYIYSSKPNSTQTPASLTYSNRDSFASHPSSQQPIVSSASQNAFTPELPRHKPRN